MRIDTARDQLAATKALLDQALAELEDLYVLAYDRQVAADEAKVAGGSRDYALDTHGDFRVREQYRAFSDKVTDTCRDLAEAAHDVLRFMAETKPAGRLGARTTSALEHALLLEAQARRAQRGEYAPHRRVAQPSLDDDLKALAHENKRLDRQVKKLIKSLSKATDRTPAEIREELVQACA